MNRGLALLFFSPQPGRPTWVSPGHPAHVESCTRPSFGITCALAGGSRMAASAFLLPPLSPPAWTETEATVRRWSPLASRSPYPLFKQDVRARNPSCAPLFLPIVSAAAAL